MWDEPRRDPADILMERYARGDDAAFTPLHALLAPRLRRAVMVWLRDPWVVDDVVQTAFLQLHRARHRFVAGSAALPLAVTIARRAAIDHLRKARREPTLIDDDGAALGTTGHESDPGAELEACEVATVIQRTLTDLPPAQRQAFALLKVQELSVREAALLVGATEMGIKLRAHRAYSALRAALAQNAAQPGNHHSEPAYSRPGPSARALPSSIEPTQEHSHDTNP